MKKRITCLNDDIFPDEPSLYRSEQIPKSNFIKFLLGQFAETLQDLKDDATETAYRQVVQTKDIKFADILLDGIRLLHLTNAEIAREFGISRYTVSRWRNGIGIPHPLARKFVYTWLLKKIQEAAGMSNIAYLFTKEPNNEEED